MGGHPLHLGTQTEYELGIVIPAFKKDFLAHALESLVRQSDQRFNIYLCDDASPDDIEGISRTVLRKREYVYTRFETNLGARSIVGQWNRCITFAQEPWIWVFSDDDVMDPHCVEKFYAFLRHEGETADIVRFDGWIIDERENIVGLLPQNIDRESWLEFTYGRLMGWRRAFMQQLVFRRCAFEKAGGFLDLPLGWHTDDAAVITMARRRPIRRIGDARVYWRSSRKNISTDRSGSLRKKKLQAVCLFLGWLRAQLDTPRERLCDADEAVFKRAMNHFLVEQILVEGALSAISNWKLVSRIRRDVCEQSRLTLLKYIAIAAAIEGASYVGGRVRRVMPGSDSA